VWWQEYKDYRYDKPLKRHKVETGKGIVGCEMNDRNGYGVTMHRSTETKQPGLLTHLFTWLFGLKR